MLLCFVGYVGGCPFSALHSYMLCISFHLYMANTFLDPSMAGSGTPLRFISWNIRGMGNPIKRSKVFTHLKRLKPAIVFLQETHLRVRDNHRLRCPWVHQVFHSDFNSKARGVVILISK